MTAAAHSNVAHPVLDPQVLLQIQSLELRAQRLMEGFLAGLHQSPSFGSSVEFTEYRQYVPGDDLRRLDWKLAARSDRHYVKCFEDETNLRSVVLLDSSGSMSYGSGRITKFEYARTLVAAWGALLRQQRDSLGLARFSQQLDDWIAPGQKRVGWRRLLASLERPPQGGTVTMTRLMDDVLPLLKTRGMVTIVTDGLSPLEPFQAALGQLLARRQEVLLFQVIDPAEEQFDFTTAEQFEDLETGQRMQVDPLEVGERYRECWRQHQQQLRSITSQWGIPHECWRTDQPLGPLLSAWLRRRGATASTARGPGARSRR
jgi:uncharacterized protein (DUF58 family)